MAINSFQINGAVINGTAGGSTVATQGATNIALIEQNVVRTQSATNLVRLQQNVRLFESQSATTLVSVEQSVTATQTATTLVSVEQSVIATAGSLQETHLERFDFDHIFVLDGAVYEPGCVSISTSAQESSASLATVVVRENNGTLDFARFQGKSALIYAITTAGTRRIFTGIVDTVDVNIHNEEITLQLTDNRRERILSGFTGNLSNIGWYSETVFGKAQDDFDELEKRLTTVPKALDYDTYGQLRITDWEPKSTPDFTINNVQNKSTKITRINRGRVVNKVNLQVNYSYTRKHQRKQEFVWNGTNNGCNVLVYGYSLTSKDMIQQAIDSSGWTLTPSGITYDPLFPSGWYSCGIGNNKSVAWSTIRTFGGSRLERDENGDVVVDSNGNARYEEPVRTRVIDYSDVYADGASWSATKRWTQNIVEQYSLTVQSPTSQSAFTTVTQDLSYSVASNTDNNGWEQNELTDSNGTYKIDNRDNAQEFQNVINTGLNVAKTMILKGHRENTVTVTVPNLRPEIELYHTVRVLANNRIDATGKVTKVDHTMLTLGHAYTTIEISMYDLGTGGSDSTLSIPNRPTDSIPTNFGTIVLGNHFGVQPTDSMTGMIGNAFVFTDPDGDYNGSYIRTKYQEQFRVDTPPIEAEIRQTKTLSGSASYNVAIPAGTMTVTIDGKLD